MPAQDLARSHVNQSVSGPDLEALRSLWFACLSDSTDVMAMLQCSAVAQQERAWELGFHIFHPECIKRVWSS